MVIRAGALLISVAFASSALVGCSSGGSAKAPLTAARPATAPASPPPPPPLPSDPPAPSRPPAPPELPQSILAPPTVPQPPPVPAPPQSAPPFQPPPLQPPPPPTQRPPGVALPAMLGINLAGGEFAEGQLPGVLDQDYAFPTAYDVRDWSAQGVKLIRLPFLWERVQPTLGGPLDAAYLGLIKDVLASARNYGSRVILDVHNYGRYRRPQEREARAIGSAEVPAAAFADLWSKLAREFRDRPEVYGYDLMNEPHDMGGPEIWPQAAQLAIDAIRRVDRGTVVILEGDGWSGAWKWRAFNSRLLPNDPSSRLVYSAHQYFDSDASGAYRAPYDQDGGSPTIGIERIRPFADWLRENGKQGFIGEIGAPSADPRWQETLRNAVAALIQDCMPAVLWAGGSAWRLGPEYPLLVRVRTPQLRALQPGLAQSNGYGPRCSKMGPLGSVEEVDAGRPERQRRDTPNR